MGYVPQAILVVDICGHSAIVQKYGSHFFMELLSELQEVVYTATERYHRSYIKGTGDGFLVTFLTIEDAWGAALEIQKKIKARNQGMIEDEQIRLRFAIHFGETLVSKDRDPHGEAVNMAFRLESLRGEQMIETQGGIPKSEFPKRDYILITEVVHMDVKNRSEFECRFLGVFEIPGFVGLHRIYQLMV
jgi:adenylate cyclase